MPSTVVCGVDDSEAGETVAEVARWLANCLSAHLVLIHTAEEPPEEAERRLTSVRVRLSLGADDDVRLLDGSPAARLLESVEGDGADLLVVGSRGRSAVRSGMFGSVSRELVTRSTCPVVVVPPHTAPADDLRVGGGTVVCGVDGSAHAFAAVRLGDALATAIGLRLVAVHALPVLESVVSYPGARASAPPLSAQPDTREREARRIVDEAVDSAAGTASGVVKSGLPWEVLESVAEREDARLLVIAARGLSALRSAVFGSVALELVKVARRPVVVLPEPAEAAFGATAG